MSTNCDKIDPKWRISNFDVSRGLVIGQYLLLNVINYTIVTGISDPCSHENKYLSNNIPINSSSCIRKIQTTWYWDRPVLRPPKYKNLSAITLSEVTHTTKRMFNNKHKCTGISTLFDVHVSESETTLIQRDYSLLNSVIITWSTDFSTATVTVCWLHRLVIARDNASLACFTRVTLLGTDGSTGSSERYHYHLEPLSDKQTFTS